MNNNPVHVLLLDDDAKLREVLAEYLRDHYAFEVDTAGTGQEALQKMRIKDEAYQVVLVDEVLEEGMNGLDVLREIKAKYPDIEVIIFTAYGLDTALEALRQGAYRYFGKPLNYDELAFTIQVAAKHGQAHRERQILAALQHVSAAINSSLDINGIFRRTCQAAVELFGVDHAGVALFEPDFAMGKVVAEYPEGVGV